MDLNDFQIAARRTAVYPPEVGLTYTVLGLTGEAGELANKLKKVLRNDGEGINLEVMMEELGDVLWYAAAVATELGLDLNQVAIRNLQKLQDRQLRDVIKGAGDDR